MNLQPISEISYHDWHIECIVFAADFAEIRLRCDSGSMLLKFLDAKFALANDVLLGNIVDYISNVVISHESIEWVLDDLLDFKSQYFTTDEYNHYGHLPELIGLNYVVITCLYGMRAGIICASIEECPLGEVPSANQ